MEGKKAMKIADRSTDAEQPTLPNIFPPGELFAHEFLAKAEDHIRSSANAVVGGTVEIGRKLTKVKGRVGQNRHNGIPDEAPSMVDREPDQLRLDLRVDQASG
jgi:hypothetical protein